jgi:hypothetical protein
VEAIPWYVAVLDLNILLLFLLLPLHQKPPMWRLLATLPPPFSYPCNPRDISCPRKPFQTANAAFWEGGGRVILAGFCTPLEATSPGFCGLQKPGDKVPFIEISLQKSLAGLLPGLGLLALAFPSFLGTPAANSHRRKFSP